MRRTNNATIEVIIEENKFNNSLAGYLNCPNAPKSRPGSAASDIWTNIYLKNGEPTCLLMIDPLVLTQPQLQNDFRNSSMGSIGISRIHTRHRQCALMKRLVTFISSIAT